MADKILFVGRRRTTDMPSVEGVDDNVPPTGYGVRGSSDMGTGLNGSSPMAMVCMAAAASPV